MTIPMVDVGLKRCGQFLVAEQCPCLASYRFTWPGRNESFICSNCVDLLRNVSAAMGLPLQIIPLYNDE